MRRSALSMVGGVAFLAILVATSEPNPPHQPAYVTEATLTFPEAPALEADFVDEVAWEIRITTLDEHAFERETQVLRIPGADARGDTVEVRLTDCDGRMLQETILWDADEWLEQPLTSWGLAQCRGAQDCTATVCLRATLLGDGPVQVQPELDVTWTYGAADGESMVAWTVVHEIDATIELRE